MSRTLPYMLDFFPPVFDTFIIQIGAVFMLAGLNSSILHMEPFCVANSVLFHSNIENLEHL